MMLDAEIRKAKKLRKQVKQRQTPVVRRKYAQFLLHCRTCQPCSLGLAIQVAEYEKRLQASRPKEDAGQIQTTESVMKGLFSGLGVSFNCNQLQGTK